MNKNALAIAQHLAGWAHAAFYEPLAKQKFGNRPSRRKREGRLPPQ